MFAFHSRLRQGRPPVRRLAVLAVVSGAVLWPNAALSAPPIPGTNGAPVPVLDWGTCPAATPEEEQFLRPYRCATAEVPLSYRDPSGQSVELAVGLLPAAEPEHKLGTLFWNPGGPGGSGRIPPPFTDELHARFDIVGFDPRGVAASTPLQCFASNEQAFRLLGWDFPITLAQEQRVIRLTARASQLCARNGGPLLEHMATGNVARDLDLLRQAVGDEQLSYIGFSYGTHLGEVYANLFPERIRAMTLDAVLDPVEWTTGDSPADALAPFSYRVGSYRGADQALSTFLAACAGDARWRVPRGRSRSPRQVRSAAGACAPPTGRDCPARRHATHRQLSARGGRHARPALRPRGLARAGRSAPDGLGRHPAAI